LKAAVSTGVMAYAGLCIIGARGLASVSNETQVAIRPYVWLLGPPANLVHGTDFLWPFLIGTLVLGMCAFMTMRSRRFAMKTVWSAMALVAWAMFGFLAYAPSA
jgi:hypothetical protein